MKSARKRRLRPKEIFGISVFFTFFYLFIWPVFRYKQNVELEYGQRLITFLNQTHYFTYDTSQTCRFPIIDPFDPSILSYVRHPTELKCAKVQPNFVTPKLNRLYLDYNLARQHGLRDLKYSLFRRQNGSDYGVTYDPFREFKDTISMNGANGCVLRGSYGENKAYVDIFPSVNPIFPKKPKNDGKYRPNVMIIGIDSVSRSNFIRNLPKTYEYLTEKISGFDFRGYAKIDDNTSPNMIALTIGRKVTVKSSELPLDPQKEFVDKWPFIWKNFSKNGYTTLLAEEQPGIWSYKAMGFKYHPTDVYFRPFAHILNDNPIYRSLSPYCYLNMPESEHVLRGIERFIESQTSQQLPYFLFSFLWKLSHDDINMIERLDTLLSSWLQRIHTRGLLRETFIVFMSDHGNRFDDIRSTLIGRYEERMPFLFIRPPESMLQKYPEVKQNLANNLWRFTNQYDVYETLADIVNNQINVKSRESFKNRGHSLFREIPLDRTCKDANIDEHFCVCQEEQPLDKTSSIAKKAADAVINEINKELELVKSLCVTVELENILDARLLKANEKVKNNNRWHFDQFIGDSNIKSVISFVRLTLKAKPNNALFEASVQVSQTATSESYAVTVDQISRINSYGLAAKCVSENVRKLEKICTCSESSI
ncbi:unnamed protein product [Bursaphelenchus okinawaensis]|uniref:Sulfatase domain-containing protein n=1 Tax=Bursaphelenchus okinawaensis TaxID=465554 RepID=A0A811KRN3_9BILA|nr:unnamed protein product [Bursaphelenchus okinawaensis]CAG9110439.1 unnamed protein product [Bursaphelenchus okinawaensis]